MIAYDHNGSARIARVTAKGVKLREEVYEAGDVGRRPGSVGVRGRRVLKVHVAK